MNDDAADDYWNYEDDDGGFEDYEATTVDPGPYLIVGTFLACLLLLALFAICLKCVRKRRKLRKQAKQKTAADELNITLSTADNSSVRSLNHLDSDSVSSLEEADSKGCEACFVFEPALAGSTAPPVVRPHTKRNARRLRGAATLMRKFMPRLRSSERRNKPTNDGIIMLDDASISVGSFKVIVDEDHDDSPIGMPCAPLGMHYNRMEEDIAVDRKDRPTKASAEIEVIEGRFLDIPGMIESKGIKPKSPRRPGIVSKLCRKFHRVAQYDREMQRLVALAVPYTLNALFECVFGLLQLAVIGKLMGTRALSAFIAVDFLLTLTSIWLEGAMSSLLTICSQAVGADKPKLAGEYVQIAVLMSQFFYIPQLVLWMYLIDDAILWLGFDQETAAIGSDYATIVLFHELYGFWHDGIYHLLDVCDHEQFSAVVSVIYHAVEFGCVLAAALLYDPSLRDIGIIHFALDFVFFCLSLVIIQRMGWFRDYWRGLIGTCALGNFRAVKYFFQTATPLSFGYVLTNGEWEILFLLAGVLGPAEVAAFGIVGEIWDSLETCCLAVADAAEVRCAYLLGNGKPKRAQRSAQKSLYLGVIVGTIGTAILIGCCTYIPQWLTNDETLQGMVQDLLPLVGIGNFMLTLGSVSWILLGAQGRYALSTGVAFVGSWMVTLPLAILSALYFGYDLRGLAAAVVVGYMTSGMINTLLLLDSDWEYLSVKIQEYNRADVHIDLEPDLPREVLQTEGITMPVVGESKKAHPVRGTMMTRLSSKISLTRSKESSDSPESGMLAASNKEPTTKPPEGDRASSHLMPPGKDEWKKSYGKSRKERIERILEDLDVQSYDEYVEDDESGSRSWKAAVTKSGKMLFSAPIWRNFGKR